MKQTNRQIVPARPKYVARIRKDKLEVESDPTVELMGMLGLSYRAIRLETRLSNYQIAKQLKARKIKLRDYRDAVSPIGKQVLHRINYLAEKRIVDHIEKYLLK